MRKVCPKDPTHNEFITTAHEQHEWLVNGEGEFKEDLGCMATTHAPDPQNCWTCKECFAEAVDANE